MTTGVGNVAVAAPPPPILNPAPHPAAANAGDDWEEDLLILLDIIWRFLGMPAASAVSIDPDLEQAINAFVQSIPSAEVPPNAPPNETQDALDSINAARFINAAHAGEIGATASQQLDAVLLDLERRIENPPTTRGSLR